MIRQDLLAKLDAFAKKMYTSNIYNQFFMKKQLKNAQVVFAEMWKKKPVQLLFGASIIFLAITFLIPYLELYPEVMTKTAVPLHYNIHFGVDMFGAWWRVFTPSIVGLLIIMINTIFAIVYWSKDKMLSYSLLLTSVVLHVFLILATIFMTLLNLSYD